MGNPRRNLYAVIIAGVSFLLVIGAMLTALADTGFSPAPPVTATDTSIPVFTPIVNPTQVEPEKMIPTEPSENTPAPAIATLPQETATTTSDVVTISPTSFTPSPTLEKTEAPVCTKPLGWATYTVKSGDTLFSIAIRYQTNVATLQGGNCMGSSTRIITGDFLWVPNNPTITPSPTSLATKTKTVCYSLTLTIAGSGSDLTASPQKSDGCTLGSYLAGEKIGLTAAPAAGWTVGNWAGTDNNASTAKTNTLTMPGNNHTASVTYLGPTCYPLSLTYSGSGTPPSASPSSSPDCTTTNTYVVGEIITLMANPASGGVVSAWTGTNDDNITDLTNFWTMQASDHTVNADYLP